MTVDEQIKFILQIQEPVIEEQFSDRLYNILSRFSVDDIYKQEAFYQKREKSLAKKK